MTKPPTIQPHSWSTIPFERDRTLTAEQAQALRHVTQKVFGTYLQLSQLLKELDITAPKC